jgi:hypothetical protein
MELSAAAVEMAFLNGRGKKRWEREEDVSLDGPWKRRLFRGVK